MSETGADKPFPGIEGLDTTKGPQLITRPLSFNDYSSIRTASLSWHRKQQIASTTENAKSVDDVELRRDLIRGAFLRAEEISYESLGEKKIVKYKGSAEDQSKIPIDEREVEEERYVEYCLWWCSTSVDGMLYAIWLSAKKEETQKLMTIDDIRELFEDEEGNVDELMLDLAASKLGRRSQGNSGASEAGAVMEAKKKRRKRKKVRKLTGSS